MISDKLISEIVRDKSSFAFCGSGEPPATPELSKSSLPDGSWAIEDATGCLVFFGYASGATVRRHPSMVLVRTEFGEAWVGAHGLWLRLN